MNHSLIIRSDANTRIGTGHIMRCIALAQAWKDQGGEVTFISHCESEALRQRIIDEGFDFISVENPHPDPSDLKATVDLLLKIRNPQSAIRNWLVLDGYHFTPDYQKAIRDARIGLLVIDDMNHLPHYHADILLNQNINALDLKYHCDSGTTLLLGTRYVLLRRQFLKYRDFKRQIPDRAKNILITLGGGDPDNVTLKVIEAIKLLNHHNLEVKVVVGPSNPHIKSLENTLLSAQCSMHCIENAGNMPELMAWADMAISAGGSTCWELAFTGVPNIVMTLADNQKSVADGIAKTGMALNIGWHNIVESRLIAQTIDKILLSEDTRADMAQKGRAAIDGEGANRLIKQINGASISIRKVTESDCELIWHWVNDEETRKASYSQTHISWIEHTRWFDYVRRQKNHRFYIVTNGNNRPVGQIRFTIDGKDAIVSFSVAPESRRQGHGRYILIKSAKKIFNETSVKRILAYVKSENMVSWNVFQKAGFRVAEEVTVCGVRSYKMILTRMDLL